MNIPGASFALMQCDNSRAARFRYYWLRKTDSGPKDRVMRYTAWLAAIAINAFVATWVTGATVLWGTHGAFPGWWLIQAIPPALAVASLLWQRPRQSVVWMAALVTNMLLATWLVIGFAAVLPRPNAYLWGYSEAIIALPSMLAVIAHAWPRARSPRRIAVVP